MRSAIPSCGYAAMCSRDLHIQLWICDGIPHLIAGATSCENPEGRGKRDKPLQRETRGHRHHILLLYTAIEKTVRVHRLKIHSLRSFRNVCVEDDEVGHFSRQLQKRIYISLPRMLKFHIPILSWPVQNHSFLEEFHAS